ncbi:MAG: hypothetical protein DSZ28_07260 [Thiothrix sp.]|nr:MAG: hypothetical protein DSZ28_07260 [Thiothrix sp.]
MNGSVLEALDSPTLEFEIDSPTGDRQVPYSNSLAVVSGFAPVPTLRTHGRFFRRRKVMMREYLSPKTSFNIEQAVNPSKQKSERMDLGSLMPKVYLKTRTGFHVTGNSK